MLSYLSRHEWKPSMPIRIEQLRDIENAFSFNFL